MNRTFATRMPNHIGAFLKASRCFASLGINITRVSYNKAVDSHMLFLDAEGTEEQLSEAAALLEEIGYLSYDREKRSVILLEFCLPDHPGSVTAVLELISGYGFNISYISSAENGSPFQYFKMGLQVEDPEKIKAFIEEAKKICDLRVLDLGHADRIYDNSFFYATFVRDLSSAMEISEKGRRELLINTNLAMQTLDDTGVSPYRTFDSISRFAMLLSKSRGEGFTPRITAHPITEHTEITLIEPPCGSNTAIIKSCGEYLFVDTGYACYREEMLQLLNRIVPEFMKQTKRVFLSHADPDHAGLLSLFDEIYASHRSRNCLELEYRGQNSFREENPLHKPYIRICKALTSYEAIDTGKIRTVGDEREITQPLCQTGSFDFGELHFDLYEGKGGHLAGESILIDYEHRIVFSGDIYVNMKEMTPQQAEYNRYAPILMTSVDTDQKLCAEERKALFSRLGVGSWQIYGGHGGKKTYTVSPAS